MKPAAFTRAAFRRGFVAALPFLLTNSIAGAIMGVAYKGLGLDPVAAVLFSLVVYSATAQAVVLGMWTLPLPITAMVVACLATNSRYLLMGAHLRPLFGTLRKRVMLPVLFLLGDSSWMMTAADAERNGPDAGYLLGASVPMAIGWIGGTGLGYGLPMSSGGPLAIAAALLPAMFVVTLLPTQWRGIRSLWPWSASALAALVVIKFVGPSWAMLIGGGIGTTVSMVTDDV
jgi:predicted branched-subunit amino acid permease